MSTFYPSFGSGAFTITLAGLAGGAARQSAVLDLAGLSPVPEDLEIVVKLKTGASVGGTATCSVYAYGSADGSTFLGNVSGVDGAYTFTAATNLKRLGLINIPAAATPYIGGGWSLAGAFGGTLLRYVGLVVVNDSTAALDGTAGNFAAQYGTFNTMSV